MDVVVMLYDLGAALDLIDGGLDNVILLINYGEARSGKGEVGRGIYQERGEERQSETRMMQ
jgi:hypothetical protein